MWRNLVLASRVVAGATLPSHRHSSSKIIRRISQQSAAPPVAPPPSRVLIHKDPYLRIAPATYIPRHGTSAVHRYFASSSSSISTDNSNSTSFPFRDRPDEGHRIAGLPDQLKLLEKQDAASLSPAEQNLLQTLRHHHQPRSGEAAIPDSTQTKTDIPEDVLASYSRLRDCYVALEYWDYALQTEQEIENLLISSNDDDDNNNNDQRAASWYRQGLYWRRLGELSVTTKLWKSILEYYQQKLIDNPTTAAVQQEPMLGQVLISLAGVDYSRGHYQAAAQRLAEAEPHCVANVNMWVECLQHQGSVYQSMADVHEPPEDSAMTMALEKYQQAIELLEQEQKSMDGSDHIINAEDIENRLLALRMTIADLLGSMEDQPQKLQDARQIYESLLESHCTNTKTDSNTGDTLEASLRYKLGRLLAHQPEHRTIALEHLQRAVALERSLAHSTATGGVSLTLAHSLNVLGAVHAALAQHATARECFREALLLAQVLAGHEQATNDPLVLQILHNLDTLKQEHRQQQQQQQQQQQSDTCADPILSHPRQSGD